jgi:hypothetical protein
LSPLAGLTSLQTLDLYWCKQLRDLSPLAGLIPLQTLNLSYCDEAVSGDLSPLAGLTSLQSLSRPFPSGRPHFAPIAQPLDLRPARIVSKMSSMFQNLSDNEIAFQWL